MTKNTSPYQSLFGPVFSRRLGLSLGVDMVCHKTCTLDCVYCECGATTDLTLERKAYVPVEQVKNELKDYFRKNEKIDYVTFSGSGEPTLNDGIGEIIQFLKADYPQYKVALLTNSTLLDQPLVQQQIKDVDVVMASLDAVTEEDFLRVNRPHPKLCLDEIIQGLVDFRHLRTGRMIIEVLLVKDLNDSDEALVQMKKSLGRIQADGVVLNTLDRPPACDGVFPIDPDRLNQISDFFKNTEIVQYPHGNKTNGMGHTDLLARLETTVRRRPYTAMDLAYILGSDIEQVQGLLNQLVAARKLTTRPMARGLFYLAA